MLLAVWPRLDGEHVPVTALRPLLRRWWFEIVGSGLEGHLKAGVQVDRVRTLGGFSSYFVGYFTADKKAYQHEPPVGFRSGRWWGISASLLHPVELLPVLEQGATVRARRVIRKRLQAKGVKGRAGQTVYTAGSAAGFAAQLQGFAKLP